MPRKAKTQPTTTTAPGQPYGMASQQVAAMEQIPLPDTSVTPQTPQPTASAQTPPSEAPMGAPTAPPDPLAQALMDAQAMPAPTAPAFSTPPTPDELSSLQTFQPNIVDQRAMSPVAKLMQEMAIAYAGDERLEEMVRNSNRMGY